MKRRQFIAGSAGFAGAWLAGIPQAIAKPCPPPTSAANPGTSTSTVCATNAGAPPWFGNIANRAWGTPVSNWLGDSAVRDPMASTGFNGGTTGHRSIIIAWTGMGCDELRKTIWMAGNGGHADYAGNEVYACDLSANTPAWTRRRDASTAPANNQQVMSQFPDNTPPSDHTGMHQIAAEGRWFKLGLGSPNWLGPPAGRQAWEFNPGNNTWIDRGQGLLNDIYAITGCAAYDPQTRRLIKVVASGNPSVQFIDMDTFATVESAGQSTGSSSSTIAAVDTENRMLLWRAGDFPNNYFVMDLENISAGWTTVPVSGSAPPPTFAFHWHVPSQAYITWDGAGGIKKLTPTRNGRTYTGLTWSSVPGVGGPAPVHETDLMYNKIQLIRNMGNGDAALVVVPRYAAPDVYVMRIVGAV